MPPDSETYIPCRAQEDAAKLCIYSCYLHLSYLIFLSPQNPSFPSSLLTFLIPHLPVLSGHLSIPRLTFLFWQLNLPEIKLPFRSPNMQSTAHAKSHNKQLFYPEINSCRKWSFLLKLTFGSPSDSRYLSPKQHSRMANMCKLP